MVEICLNMTYSITVSSMYLNLNLYLNLFIEKHTGNRQTHKMGYMLFANIIKRILMMK